jgi:hypothetical protein
MGSAFFMIHEVVKNDSIDSFIGKAKNEGTVCCLMIISPSELV